MHFETGSWTIPNVRAHAMRRRWAQHHLESSGRNHHSSDNALSENAVAAIHRCLMHPEGSLEEPRGALGHRPIFELLNGDRDILALETLNHNGFSVARLNIRFVHSVDPFRAIHEGESSAPSI